MAKFCGAVAIVYVITGITMFLIVALDIVIEKLPIVDNFDFLFKAWLGGTSMFGTAIIAIFLILGVIRLG